MIKVIRTDSSNEDFISLVKLLDSDLALRDGADNAYYAQFNKIDLLKNCVVAYIGGQAIGCGAFKSFEEGVSAEVKRMYVLENHRGKGIAGLVLKELEQWAAELGYSQCVLETGKRQPEAIALYTKHGYQIIENYGQYKGLENSVCFEKTIA
ncbi:MAG: GNAT family N-acetyltransferase [Cytophagia bacterium]|nr:GNAT family N-acetyltransferase [Cytophagia bacterium]